MSEWMPVSKWLPDETKRGVRCLVTYRCGSRHTVVEAKFSGGQWRFVNGRDKLRLPERVTHWMLMPKPTRSKP